MEDINTLIDQMSLEEKASMCSGLNFWFTQGLERLGIPSIMLTDGPHGLRKQLTDPNQPALTESAPATCFPTASALAASWNRDLIYQVGVALGEACRQEKVGVILGPGLNIKRSPLCGRNFEYFSEDPYLTGEIAKSHINGVQSQGIGACIKHFAANNQESHRMSIDTIVDERALREIYLAGFETAIREAQPWSVMCAYNRINGTFASDNKYLMNDILRDQWGYRGMVVTDWGAMNDCIAALHAGVDLEMPGPSLDNTKRILEAVQSGELEEIVLDRAVERILKMISRAEATLAQDFSYDPQAHHDLARRTAGEGVVLLKNDGGILPLGMNEKLALIGRFAKYPRYQGAGSSEMNPTRLDNLFSELTRLVGEDRLRYAPGYTERSDTADEALIHEALDLARQSDVVIICAGLTELYEIEGIDRQYMRLPAGHDALIHRLAAAHERVMVVLSNGSPVEMPWVNDVPAILEGYLGGQAGSGALADILTGKVNPSGKLAETFPLQLSDTPAQPYPGGPATVEYRESIYVGYRYYDTAGIEVLFPFGHGLSYTRFEYRDLAVTQSGETLVVTFKVMNVGEVAGKEIAQLYVRDLQSTNFRPDKELKGFVKVELSPSQETEVTLWLDRRAFAYYDPGSRDWVVEGGQFEILVGASSQDIRLSTTIQLPGSGKASTLDKDRLAGYFDLSAETRFSQAEFEFLLGHPSPPNDTPPKGSYTLNTPISQMSDSLIGRQLYRFVNSQMAKLIKGQEETLFGIMTRRMATEISLRVMLLMDDTLNLAMAEALLLMINGRFIKGMLNLTKSTLLRNQPYQNFRLRAGQSDQ